MAADDDISVNTHIERMTWQRIDAEEQKDWTLVQAEIQSQLNNGNHAQVHKIIDSCLYHLQSDWSVEHLVTNCKSIPGLPWFARSWLGPLFNQIVLLVFYIHLKDDVGQKITDFRPLLDRLWLLHNNPMNIGNIATNWRYYVKRLENTRPLLSNKMLSGLQRTQLADGSGYYNACQASVRTVPNRGYILCQRMVNYTQKFARQFTSMDKDNIVRTTNMLCWLDADLKIIKQRPIVNTYSGTIFDAHVKGWEDMRLFWTGQYDECLAATLSTWETRGNSVFQALIYLPLNKNEIEDFTPEGDGTPINVSKLIPLDSPTNAPCEKNWLPFPDKPKCWIYNYNPLTFVDVDDTNGSVTITEQKPIHFRTNSWRGSAPPISFDNGFLLTVHETSRYPNEANPEKIEYYTRFVWLNDRREVSKVSPLFYFDHSGVEFTLSMDWDLQGNEILIAVGLEDAELQIYAMHPKDILAILTPIDQYWKWVGSVNY